ncbi:MAG: UxaA family hydrolase [Candidatus Baldrarchaeia archaeon]
MFKVIYKVHPEDNVGTALVDLKPGDTCDVLEEGTGVIGKLTLKTRVPRWHKVALTDIGEEEQVLKFGFPIGIAAIDIPRGTVVHITRVILDTKFDFFSLVNTNFTIGIASMNIKRGDAIRAGKNVIIEHELLKEVPKGTRIGWASSTIREGEEIWLGNLIEMPTKYGWNPKYRELVKEFYKMIRCGLISFTRG